MTSRNTRRQFWGPMVVAVSAWALAGIAAGQEQPANGSHSDEPNVPPPSVQQHAQPISSSPTSQPTTRPASTQPTTTQPATTSSATSQETARRAIDRLEHLKNLREQAAESQASGSQPTTTPSATTPPPPPYSPDDFAAKREEARRRAEELRRKALASTQRSTPETPTTNKAESIPATDSAPAGQEIVPSESDESPAVEGDAGAIDDGEPALDEAKTGEPNPEAVSNLRERRRKDLEHRRAELERQRAEQERENRTETHERGGRRRTPSERPGNTAPGAKTNPGANANPTDDERTTSAVERATGVADNEPDVEAPPPPADGRTEFIDFIDMPWEDVIKLHVAERYGKPLMGDDYIPPGNLTYVSQRRFTKDEVIDELNYLLLEADRVLVETEDYFYLIPDSELGKFLDLTMMFDTYEDFEKAAPRDMQICSVLFRIKGRPADEILDMLVPSMPDRTTVVTIGDTNAIKVVGLALDIRRFNSLLALIDTEKFDPLTTEFISIKTNVGQIVDMVRERFEISQPQRRYNPRTRQWETVGGEGGTNIRIIPDERTKTIIVRASQADLKEVKEFIEKIDAKPDIGEFETTVIPVQYGDASEIANLLNEIFQQEQGQQSRATYRPPVRTTASSRTPTRTVTPQNNQQANPEDIIVEDIYERAKKTVRIVADSRTNNLIVYANEDGLNRVKEMLDKIDVPIPSNFRTFELQHVEATDIQPIVEQFVRSLAGTSVRTRMASRGPEVVADPRMNVLYVLAEREAMDKVAEIVEQLDIEGPEDSQHVVELTNLSPSRVATMIQPLLTENGTASRVPTRSRTGRTGRAAATAQVIPLDEANILIVICDDETWAKVERTITIWDENAVSDVPIQKFFTINNADPESIANLLNQLYRQYAHPVLGRSQVLIDSFEQQVVVRGVKPAVDEIEALIPSLDVKPQQTPLTILPLANADAEQVAQLAQDILPVENRGVRRNRGGNTTEASVQAEPVTNSLLIQADELTTQRVVAFAKDMDTRVAEVKPERRYYSLKHAAARDVVTAVTSLFGGSTGSRGRSRFGAVGDQVKAVIVGSQVVIDAPAAKQNEIASLIEQLDTLGDQGISTILVKMPGAQVNSIAQRLTGAFQERVRSQGAVARFEPDTSTETILMTLSKDVREEAETLLSQYKELTSDQVWESQFYQLKHASADEASRWLRDQIVAMVTQQIGSSAARQVKVVGDDRTNRLSIYAPSIAVKQGLLLLDQFDQETQTQPTPPIDVWTVSLPGLDVRSLASQLKPAVDNICRDRPDRLRATVNADDLTNSLIISAPKDIREQVDKLVADFSAQTPDLTPEQKIVEIKNADANYVANQVRGILNVRVSQQRGASIARQVNLTPDTRLNKIVINAPKFAIEMAEALITELDQKPTTEGQLRTIELTNADANTMVGILNTIFREQIRARTLQISVEPLTNSLIVGGSKEDFDEIQKWATELDAKAVEKMADPVIIELKSANPWEVYNVLSATYVQRSRGRVQQPGQEIKISIVAGRSLVVQAPPDKLEEIKALAEKLDTIGIDTTVMRTYTFPGMGAELNDFARQIERAANANIPPREQRVSIQAIPASDALIVAATQRQFELVESAMDQFRDLYKPSKIETIKIANGQADIIYQALTRVLQPKIRSGKIQLGVEPMTNSLIVSAGEEDMASIRDWAAKFDEAAGTVVVKPQIFDLENANPWEVRNILDATFTVSGRRAAGGQEIRFDVVGGRSVVVKAPADKMKDIADLIAELDKVGANKYEVRTYVLPGMGNRINDLARNVQNAVNAQVSAREQRISVNTYAPGDAMIVTATPKQFEQVEQMMDQFKELMTVAKSKTEFYQLKFVDASQIVNVVRDQVTARVKQSQGSRGTQDFNVSADPRTNRLIVFAPESMLPEVQEVVESLDIEVPDDNVVTIELKYADPWETRNVINDVFGNRGSRHGDAATQGVYVTVSNNTLVVKAPPKKLEAIKDMIAKIDAQDPGELQIKMYDLHKLDAQQVAFQVQMFLRSMSGVTKRGQMQPGAFAEPTTNTLVVIAKEDQLPMIEGLIAQIESKEVPISEARAYSLDNVRAEQIARNVETMLRAKVAEQAGPRAKSIQTAVMAEPESNRLIVFAPTEYHDLTDELIHMIDKEVETGEIVQIISLEQADAASMARTANDLLKSGSVGRGATPPKVTVIADTGSNSLILKGLPKDVAALEKTVGKLESDSSQVPELKIFNLNYASTMQVADMITTLFGGGRNPADQVTVTEDEYYDRLYVTANKRKMREIEGYVEQLDAAPTADGEFGIGNKDINFVQIYRGDPYDIAWDVSDLYPPPPQGPTIESDFFGEYIKVICRPGEFDGILKNIRKFEAQARVEMKVKETKITGDVARVMAPLMAQYAGNPLYDFGLADQPQGFKDSLVIELRPPGDEPPGVKSKKPESDKEGEQSGATNADAPAVAFANDTIRSQKRPETAAELEARIREYMRGTYADGSAGQDAVTSGPSEEDRVSVRVYPDGRVIIRGPKDKVEDLEDSISTLESDLGIGEVIRIFKFNYGDVAAAARVLDLMFNDRVSSRLPQQLQQMQALQQQAQQRQQRGQQPGQNGRDQQQPGGDFMSQIQRMIGGGQQGSGSQQKSTTPLRIATDLGNSYLIVKCDEAQLPEIQQLLRELDIPPGEVEVKVFQLKNVDAGEAADNIKGVLGISSRQETRRTQTAGRNAQQQLMEILQQQAVSLGGEDGATKIDSVEIVSNKITNSLLVSAPPDVMKLVQEMIDQLEGLEASAVVVIGHYKLDHAKADDVLPLLQEIFAQAVSGGGRGQRAASPAELGPVSISGDPRVNTIIYTCQQKDVDVVERQIKQLDIDGPIADVEMYVVLYGDAMSIAAVAQETYAAAGGNQRNRQQATLASTELRISSEPMTNTIIVYGPAEKRALVLAQIKELDAKAKSDVREIIVLHAKAEQLAETLAQIFGGSTVAASTGGRGRSGRSNVASATGRVVVFGDDDAKKILVRAPDHIFAQMKELVETLDVESQQLKIRPFAVKHADAQVVVDSVKAGMTEMMQMQRMTGGDSTLDIDAFTAIPDPRTNSIMVVGTEETFLFVQQLLDAVDVATPDEQRKQFRVFVLDNIPAENVSDAINAYASGGAAASVGNNRRRGNQGSTIGGAMLDVQAIAEPSTNAVMVYGRSEDIDTVRVMVIEPLEKTGDLKQFATYEVKQTTPTQLVSYIQPFLSSLGSTADQSRNRNAQTQTGMTVQLVPNDNNKTIVAYGSTRQLKQVEDLVARFDSPDTGTRQFELIPVPWGQDASSLAAQVEALVNDSERLIAEQQNRQPRLIVVQANPETNSIMVAGEPSQFAMAKTIVQQIKDIDAYQPVTRIIELKNLSATEAQSAIENLQQPRSGSSSGTSIRRPSSSSMNRSSSTPTRRPSNSNRRRGGWLWDSPAQPLNKPTETPAGGTRFVGTLVVTPWLLLAQDAEDEPAASDVVQEGPVSTLQGQLKGEVISSPLDARRIVVTGDAADVEFIVQMLAFMEAQAPATEIKVFKLKQAKAASLAPLLQQAVEAYIQTLDDTVSRADRVSIISEARGNAIIVTASELNMALIAQMIEQLDYDTGVDTQTKVVQIHNMRASEAAELVSQAWTELQKIREVPAAAQASIIPDNRANTLVVIGTSSDISDIENLVEGIDVEITKEEPAYDWNVSKVVIKELQNATATDLAETLNSLIEVERGTSTGQGRSNAQSAARQLVLSKADGTELPPLDLDKPIRILPENGKNALIMFSTEKNNEALLEIAGMFDELPLGADIELKAISLKYADSEHVAETLDGIFKEGKTALNRPSEGDSTRAKGQMPPAPASATGRGLPYNVLVSHDSRTNTVFVVGRKDAVLLAGSLIVEMDQPGTAMDLKGHIVALKQISAANLKEQLDEMLKDRLDSLGGDANKARDSAILTLDDRSNSLIVMATDEMYKMVSDLAKQLDDAASYRVVASDVRRLEYADAAKLAALLQGHFDNKSSAVDKTKTGQGGTNDVLFVLADARSNSVMMTGTRDYLDEANRYLDQLDKPFDPTVVFKVRPVVLNSAANIAARLQDLVDKSRQQDKTEGTPLTIAADPYSNSLLIAASQEDMVMIERWVELLDRPAEPGRITSVIPLKHGDAQELSQRAQDLFSSSAQGAENDVTVTYDTATNSIVAIGPLAVVHDIEDFVRKLSAADGFPAAAKVFKLEQADASDAGDLLRSILEGRGGSVGGTGSSSSGGTREDAANQVILVYQREHPGFGPDMLKAMRREIVVIDDLRTNSLWITAPPDSMELVESLVTAIDVPPDAAKIRVFKLRNADAEETVNMLEKLFQQEGQSTTRSTTDQERVLVLEGGTVGGRQVLTFTSDPRTNSVIAAGTTGYLDVVDELILELDSQNIRERKTLVYDPRNAEAPALQQAIQDYNDKEQEVTADIRDQMSLSQRLEQQIVSVASEDTGHVIIGYDPRRESEVLELLRQLDQAPDQVMIQVLIVEVTMNESLELGVEFAFQDLQYTKAGPTDTTTFDFVGGTDVGAAGTGLGGFTFTITGADFNFLIRALQNEGSLSVLSRPQILAMDNLEARIEITNDVPYVNQTSTTSAGQVTTSVSRQDVGITLEVTPHINPDGFVRMHVMQEVSDLTGSTIDVGQGVTAPIFFKRVAETDVTVKDNETAVLGGLITSRDEISEQKIPVLGDIPVIGLLFRNNTVTDSRTELLVILTPRVLRTIEDLRELSVDERDLAGTLPDDVLTSSMMQGLRVRPDELAPKSADGMIGPFPDEAGAAPVKDDEVYGPTRTQSDAQDKPDAAKSTEQSYDVPVTGATRVSSAADPATSSKKEQ